MSSAIDGVLRQESPLAMNLAPKTTGAYFNDLFLWRSNEAFRAFVFESPLPELASQILGSAEVRLLYDQLFVMEPGGKTGTPWHQDLPYWHSRHPQFLWITRCTTDELSPKRHAGSGA